MNLAFALGPAAGGSPESIRLTVEVLKARGHRVKTVEFPPWRGSEHGFVGPGWWLRSARLLLPAAHQAEVIHAQDRRWIVGAWLAGRLTGRPVVVTVRDAGLLCPLVTCLVWEGPLIPANCGALRLWNHCAPWYLTTYRQRGRGRIMVRWWALGIERALARRARLAVPSQGLADFLAPHLGRRPDVLPSPVVVPFGHDDCDRDWLDLDPSVLFVGKPSLGKGFLDFALAAADLAGRAKFVHAGQQPRLPCPTVLSVGPLTREELEVAYCAAAVVVVPSRCADALPRVALEAQAHGRPVVGTTMGGIPDIVEDGATGLLVPPARHEHLTKAIASLLDAGPDARRVLGQAGRARMEALFSPAVVAEAHERLYGEVTR